MSRKRFNYFISWSSTTGFGSGILSRDNKPVMSLEIKQSMEETIADKFKTEGPILLFYKYIGATRKKEE